MDILINIDVDDLARAETFYTTAFELRVARRFGSHSVELLGGSSPMYLLVKPAGTPATVAGDTLRTYARHWTPVHADFVVTDMDLAVTRALAAGAVQEREVTTHSWGKLALMADPFGNGFCLVQFLGRGYDEIATEPRN